MKKKMFVTSDIHGCYDEFYKMLQQIKYDPHEHQLIILGDYTDRGPKSRETVEFVKKLTQDGAIALKGNHDQMFIDFIEQDDPLFLYNGGGTTLLSYFGEQVIYPNKIQEAKEDIIRNYSHHIDFLKSLPFYYETERHIFVHAGIDPHLLNWKDMPPEDMMWIRDEFIFNDHNVGKVVVAGHTPTVNIQRGNPNPWFGKNKILIDGGLVFGYQLNCLEINEDETEYKVYTF
ncbi:Serine/threonine-protein phosphatase 1 [compost metagenome]